MKDAIKKALGAADSLLQGEQVTFKAEDFEQAMFDHAEARARSGESGGQAFARLADEGDETISKLWAACDAARWQATHARHLAKRAERPHALAVLKSAEDELDRFVKQHMREEESFAAATDRLLRESEQARAIVAKQRAARNLL